MRKVLSWLLLIAGSLVLVGVPSWNYHVSQRNFVPAVPQLSVPTPTFTPTSEPAQDDPEDVLDLANRELLKSAVTRSFELVPEVQIGSRPVTIRIEAIGLDDPLEPVGLGDKDELDPPRGVIGWYDGSYFPGEPGPTLLAAHVAWRLHGPDKFARLSELVPGNQIYVVDEHGEVFTYTVSDLYQIDKADEAEAFFADVVYDLDAPHALWLVTCGGDLQGGSFTDNLFVRAELIDASTSD
jgi:sortase (surface protein transpeptidase)